MSKPTGTEVPELPKNRWKRHKTTQVQHFPEEKQIIRQPLLDCGIPFAIAAVL